MIEGSFEVKLLTIWTDGKIEVGRVREEKKRSEKIREEKEWEERRCRCTKRSEGHDSLCFFQWFGAPAGRKVTSLKRRVRSHLARWEMKNCTPLWRESISKSKRTKHTNVGPLLEVEMSKKCTPSWREAHFQVKMVEIAHVRTTLDVQMSKKCMPLWRKARLEVKTVKNCGFDLFLTFGCRKSAY